MSTMDRCNCASSGGRTYGASLSVIEVCCVVDGEAMELKGGTGGRSGVRLLNGGAFSLSVICVS